MKRTTGKSRIRTVFGIVAALVIAMIFAVQQIGQIELPSTQASTPLPNADKATAQQQLAGLTIAEESPLEYRRAYFGESWKDLDGNGCTPRNEVLERDLIDTTITDGCTVESGTLHDPYTGTTIDFTKGRETSQDVQIDHVVPLADGWASGADTWTDEQRLTFANDPVNLLAVDGPTNNAKGAKDAGEWLPDHTGFHCEYAARQIHVKATYDLTVDQAEHDGLARVLAHC